MTIYVDAQPYVPVHAYYDCQPPVTWKRGVDIRPGDILCEGTLQYMVNSRRVDEGALEIEVENEHGSIAVRNLVAWRSYPIVAVPYEDAE